MSDLTRYLEREIPKERIDYLLKDIDTILRRTFKGLYGCLRENKNFIKDG
jgi:hypothetical protein